MTSAAQAQSCCFLGRQILTVGRSGYQPKESDDDLGMRLNNHLCYTLYL